MVLRKLIEDSRVAEVSQELISVCTGFFNDIFQDIQFRNIKLFPVNCIKQKFVKDLEQVIILSSNRFGGTKGVDSSCLNRVVFPDLLFGIRRMIILFEREIPPRYRKFLACLGFYILQPDRRVIDERSEVIEIDVEFRQSDFLWFRHFVYL